MRSFSTPQGRSSPPDRAADSRIALAPPPSDSVNAVVLAANVAKTVNVPAGAKYVIFSSQGDFFVKYGGTATVPGADVNDGSASELNPAARGIPNGVTSIGLIATASNIVTLAFYGA